jgi:hypothetical protein
VQLADALARLEPAPEYLGQTRRTLLKLLAQQTNTEHVAALAETITKYGSCANFVMGHGG